MELANKLLAWLKKNICVIAVILIIGVYFLRNFIAIDTSGKSVLEIIADGALAGITGYIIALLLTKQGEKDGEDNDNLRKAIGEYSCIKKSSERFADRLSAWCGKRNEQDLETYQKEILSAACISWKEFVSGKYSVNKKDKQKGTYSAIEVTEDELWGIKRKAVKKARRAKITPLTDTMLMTESKSTKDPHSIGRDINEFDKTTAITNGASKIVFGVLFGYFGVKMLEDFSPASAIWAGLQIVIFIGLGVFSYMTAKLYMGTEYKGRYEAKTKYLNEFCVDMERQKNEPETVVQKPPVEENKIAAENETIATISEAEEKEHVN